MKCFSLSSITRYSPYDGVTLEDIHSIRAQWWTISSNASKVVSSYLCFVHVSQQPCLALSYCCHPRCIIFHAISFLLQYQLYNYVCTQLAAEESKALEISNLLKILDSVKSELEASNEENKSSCKKIASLQNQLDLSSKDQEAQQSSISEIEEVKRENILLKVFSTYKFSPIFLLQVEFGFNIPCHFQKKLYICRSSF